MQIRRKTIEEKVSLFRFLVNSVTVRGKKSKAIKHTSYMLEEAAGRLETDIKYLLSELQNNLYSIVSTRTKKVYRKEKTRVFLLATDRRRKLGVADCFKHALSINTSRQSLAETMCVELIHTVKRSDFSDSFAYKNEQIKKAIQETSRITIAN